jgi:ABC-2 type transport system ATP-binding protein
VIDRGIKVAEGTSDQLKSSVGSSTLHLRLAAPGDLPDAAEVVGRLLSEEPVLTPELGALNVPLTDADQAADVLIALRQSNLSISSLTVQKPTLDEVFLALTGHEAADRTAEHPDPDDPTGSSGPSDSGDSTDELTLEMTR